VSETGRAPQAPAPGALSPLDATIERWLAPSWWLYAVVTLSIFAATFGVLVKVWGRTQLDLEVYLLGARHLFDGTIYAVSLPRPPHLPFTYAPFAGLLFWPLTALSYGVAQAIWALLSTAALVGVVATSLWATRPRLSTRSIWLATAALIGPAFWLEPIEANFSFGQINIVLTMLILADTLIVLRLGRRTVPRGVLVGVAAAVKLVPLVFVAYFAATRQFRAALTSAGTFLACTALAFACNARASWRFWSHYAFDAKRIGGVFYLSNQSARGSLDRLTHSVLSTGAATVIGAAILAAGLALAAWAYRRSSTFLAVVVAGTTGLLASPISWAHHFVWVIPILAWLALGEDRPGGGCWFALGGAILAWSAPIWLVSDRPSDELRENVAQALAGNSYFLALVAFLVGIATMLFTRRRDPGRDTEPVPLPREPGRSSVTAPD
jgi:alpha-1,2-mannosyltransferase